MARTYGDYTDEDIIRIVPKVISMAGLLKELGLKPAGGNYSNMRSRLQKLGNRINTDHWKGAGWSKDNQLKGDWSEYNSVAALKPHLLKTRGHKCESCGLSKWLNKPISIEVHHIDGNRLNNNYENLQLVCPNCHSFTDNFRSKNKTNKR